MKALLLCAALLAVPGLAGGRRTAEPSDGPKKTPKKVADRAAEKPALPVPAKLMELIQTAWDDTKTYQATFKQVVFAKRLGNRDESQGTIFVAKPNRIRWESSTDGTLQIMNENKLWVVQKNRRRETVVVDIYQDLRKAVDAKPLAFLSGKSKFKDLYRVDLLNDTPTMAELRFVPHSEAGETLVAEIDKDGYLLRSLTSETVDSRTRTEFSNIKTNVNSDIKFDEKLFTYTPAATDVVHNN